MKNKVLWIAFFCVVFSGTSGSAEPPQTSEPFDSEKMQERMEQVQEQIRKQQQENMERLKEMDPKGYEGQRKSQDRQAQIGQILSAYQQKTITADDAERKLTPLVKQEVQQELAGIDSQIKTTEKKLASLKQAKNNQNALVKKRVDQMLGRGGPPTPDEMIF